MKVEEQHGQRARPRVDAVDERRAHARACTPRARAARPSAAGAAGRSRRRPSPSRLVLPASVRREDAQRLARAVLRPARRAEQRHLLALEHGEGRAAAPRTVPRTARGRPSSTGSRAACPASPRPWRAGADVSLRTAASHVAGVARERSGVSPSSPVAAASSAATCGSARAVPGGARTSESSGVRRSRSLARSISGRNRTARRSPPGACGPLEAVHPADHGSGVYASCPSASMRGSTRRRANHRDLRDRRARPVAPPRIGHIGGLRIASLSVTRLASSACSASRHAGVAALHASTAARRRRAAPSSRSRGR